MRVGLLVVLLGFIFPCAHAQGQLIRVNSAYTGESPTQLVAFLAKETGIFAKNGLDVQVIRTTSSIAVMGLLAGEMAILQVAAPTVISANLRGSDAVYVAAGVVTLDYWLMSGKNIKNGAQLKNGIIGSSDLSGHLLSPAALPRARWVWTRIRKLPLSDRAARPRGLWRCAPEEYRPRC